VPRAITEKVGIISNQRFEGDAIIGDIFLHGRTQESRDTIAYVRWAQEKGIPVYSSVEHVGQETWNERDRRYELTSLQMVGAAIVNVGACQTCTLPRANEGEPDMADDQKIKELEAALKTATDKIAALETKATAAETKVKELESKITPPAQAPGEDPKVKELEGKLADQAKASEEKIKELEAAIKKLEETPNPQTRTSGTESRELEPPAAVHVDPKSGEVYGL
jgi:chaperonin cofactor prefoldin